MTISLSLWPLCDPFNTAILVMNVYVEPVSISTDTSIDAGMRASSDDSYISLRDHQSHESSYSVTAWWIVGINKAKLIS